MCDNTIVMTLALVAKTRLSVYAAEDRAPAGTPGPVYGSRTNVPSTDLQLDVPSGLDVHRGPGTSQIGAVAAPKPIKAPRIHGLRQPAPGPTQGGVRWRQQTFAVITLNCVLAQPNTISKFGQ